MLTSQRSEIARSLGDAQRALGDEGYPRIQLVFVSLTVALIHSVCAIADELHAMNEYHKRAEERERFKGGKP